MANKPILTPNYSNGHGELGELLAASVAGMAHFAGTGPIGRTCRECESWGFPRLGKPDADGLCDILPPTFKRDPATGELCARRCYRFRQLTGQAGGAIGHGAQACRHFVERAPYPPAAFQSGPAVEVASYERGRDHE